MNRLFDWADAHPLLTTVVLLAVFPSLLSLVPMVVGLILIPFQALEAWLIERRKRRQVRR